MQLTWELLARGPENSVISLRGLPRVGGARARCPRASEPHCAQGNDSEEQAAPRNPTQFRAFGSSARTI